MVSDLQAKATALKAGRTVKKAKEEWRRPTLGDLADGRVLTFDQTVNKTGFAMVGVEDGKFIEWEHGTLRVEFNPVLTGHADTLYRAAEMAAEIETTIMVWARLAPLVVHEMPAVHGYRTESSLLAAHAVQMACKVAGLQYVGVANQHMKKVWTGNVGSTKAQVKAAIMAVTQAKGSWNQDNADALALGLTYLYDKAVASGTQV